jgi:hypothetical protein
MQKREFMAFFSEEVLLNLSRGILGNYRKYKERQLPVVGSNRHSPGYNSQVTELLKSI